MACWVEASALCLSMPALVLFEHGLAFEPAWRLEGARVGAGRVCLGRWRGVELVAVREGGRWRFYRVEEGECVRAETRVVKVPGSGWAFCIRGPGGNWVCIRGWARVPARVTL